MITGTFKSIPDAWISIIRSIYNDGVLNSTEYGLKARMVNGLAVELVNTSMEWHRLDPFCSPQRIAFYVNQFKRQSVGKTAFEYTYIDRLVNYNGFDQLTWIRDELNNGRTDSKRLQAISWIPSIDCNKKEDQPCFQRIWCYPFSDHSIDVHIHYRSNDMFKAFEANVIAFRELINDELLVPCGYSLHRLRWFVDNAHIYEDDFEAVEQILSKKE